jgi:hypothetical protein
MVNKKNVSSLSKKDLEKKVTELEQEVYSLKRQNKQNKSSIFRRLSVWLLVIICAVTLNLSVAAAWLKTNVVNTDVWVSKTSEIMKDEDFQNQLSGRITDEIFAATDAEEAIKEFVPPRASALATPLTQSLESYTNEQVKKVISSDKFQTAWVELNKSSHEGIITSIENGGKKPENSNYVMYIDNDQLLLNLNPILTRIQTDLVNSGLTFLSGASLDRVSKTVTIAEIDSLPTLLYAFDVLNKSAIVLFVVAAISGAGAIALSRKKRKTIISLCIITVLLMVLNVQSIYFARAPLVQQASSSLQSSSSAAATSVFDIVTRDLITYNRALATIAVIVLITAVMTGPSRFAVSIRTKINNIFSRKENNKVIKNVSDNATTYVGILAMVYVMLSVAGLLKNLTLALFVLVIFCVSSFLILSLRKD